MWRPVKCENFDARAKRPRHARRTRTQESQHAAGGKNPSRLAVFFSAFWVACLTARLNRVGSVRPRHNNHALEQGERSSQLGHDAANPTADVAAEHGACVGQGGREGGGGTCSCAAARCMRHRSTAGATEAAARRHPGPSPWQWQLRYVVAKAALLLRGTAGALPPAGEQAR